MNQLSPAQNEQVRKIVRNYKLTPATLTHRLSRGTWIPKQHLLYISSRIAKAVTTGNGRLIISAPPRHGKSELISVGVPTWILENFPGHHVILTAYGADLAVGFGRRVRNNFTDPQNQSLLNTKVNRDASAADAFLTSTGGGMFSTGVGGPITGRGANVLLVDDYIKEIKEALSPAARDYIWNWFATVAYTRLEPNGTVIIIATRWHTDDLIGRIMTNYGGQWENIVLPALAEPGDIIGREIGEPLFPERYPLSRLQELQDTLGSNFFQALFQQHPIDETGKISDGSWLKVVDAIPDRKQIKRARVWDLAATENGGDFTAGARVAYDTGLGLTYIEDMKRGQWSPSQVEDIVRRTALVDGIDVTICIEQEPGSSGKALVHHFATNVLKEFTVEAIPAVNNKIVRAQPLLAAAEAGKVYMLRGKWNHAFLKEFDTFPGEFDDQVDTASAAFQRLSGKKIFTASWGRKPTRPGQANYKTAKAAQAEGASEIIGRRIGATFGRK